MQVQLSLGREVSMCGKLLFANGGGLLIVAGQDIRLYVKIPAGLGGEETD